MDLGQLDTKRACDEGAEIELLHPTTKTPLGVFITVYGKDGTAFQEHMRDSLNTELRRAKMSRKRGKDDEIPTIEKQEARGIELLVVCTGGWRTVNADTKESKPVIVINGEELPFSVVNAKRVYTDLHWIRDQVDEAVADLENFLKS